MNMGMWLLITLTMARTTLWWWVLASNVILLEELSANRLLMLVLTTWPSECVKSIPLILLLVASGAMIGGTILWNRAATTAAFP